MTQAADVPVSTVPSPACFSDAMISHYSMKKGVIITAIILFAIAIGIYFGFIYMVGNAGG